MEKWGNILIWEFNNQTSLTATENFTEGRIEVTLETDDATKFITERKTLGLITFLALSDTGGDKTAVEFVREETKVTGVQNEFDPETVNADVVISEGEAICPAEGVGECSWDHAPNATSYEVKVTETGNGAVIKDEKSWTETKI